MTRRVIGRALAPLLMAGLTGACATTSGGVPRPFPVPSARQNPPPPTNSGNTDTADAPAPVNLDRQALVTTALALRGAPYRNGGADPTGFDCSGFTQYVFARYGMALPRDVRSQFETGRSIKARAIAPGDLVFFTTVGPGATHVGVAIGGGEFVHAPSSTGVVRVERLSSSYWSRRFVGARRLG